MLKYLQPAPTGASDHSVFRSPANTSLPKHEAMEMREVEMFINSHFQSITSLTDLARRTGVNTFKLKRSFKLLYGITAFNYAWGLRMAHAKILLADQSLTIKEIARIAGYNSLPNFTAGFKKWFGKPPSAFRKIEQKDRGYSPPLQG